MNMPCGHAHEGVEVINRPHCSEAHRGDTERCLQQEGPSWHEGRQLMRTLHDVASLTWRNHEISAFGRPGQHPLTDFGVELHVPGDGLKLRCRRVHLAAGVEVDEGQVGRHLEPRQAARHQVLGHRRRLGRALQFVLLPRTSASVCKDLMWRLAAFPKRSERVSL